MRKFRNAVQDILQDAASPKSMYRCAMLASITHLILLAISGFARFAITPAQASSGVSFNSPIHPWLLVLSGTIAAIFMLAANRQSANLSTKAPAADRASVMPERSGSEQSPENSDVHSNDWAELMARASHELRTPLNAVIGFSDVMQRELLGPIAHDRYREYIAHIRESGFALLKSTEDTLALTNLIGQNGAAKIAQIPLAPLLQQAWLAVPHHAANPHVELHCNVADGTLVQGNKAALRQALINLYCEAIAVAAPRAPIRMSITCEDGHICLALSCERADKEDSGDHISVDPQDCPAQAGLCLTMARTLLQLQGADLSLAPSNSEEWSAMVRLQRISCTAH